MTFTAEPPTGGPAAPAPMVLHPFDYQGVRLLDGPLAEQVAQARDFYLAIPDDDILLGFRERAGLPAPGRNMGGWCSQTTEVVFGQWLSGLARLSAATGDAELRDKALRLLGGWGEAWDTGRLSCSHYGYDKYVCGLVDLTEYAGAGDAALPLLSRLTRWAEANLGRDRLPATDEDSQGGFFNGQLEWYTLPENLYRAFRLTGDERYRDFARVWHYPHYWDMFREGRGEPEPHGFHGYSHANALCSAFLAARDEGDPGLLAAVVRAHDYFTRTQCYATGGYGPGEKLMRPDGELGEALEAEANAKHLGGIAGRSFEAPCGSWAVFKLCRYLLEATGHARFGDWAERVLYNGIGASLAPRKGGYSFYYADYRLGGGEKRHLRDPWPCCSGTYLQCVADYHNLAYFRDGRGGLAVNLYVPSEASWEHPEAGRVTVAQRTGYPEDEAAVFEVRPERAGAEFVLRFRVPAWSGGVGVSVNGRAEPATVADGWAAVRRAWSPGDRAEVRVPLEVRAVPVDPAHPGRVAFARGPAVLVRTHETLAPVAGPVPAGGGGAFEWAAESRARLVPFSRVGRDTPYRMYFDLAAPGQTGGITP